MSHLFQFLAQILSSSYSLFCSILFVLFTNHCGLRFCLVGAILDSAIDSTIYKGKVLDSAIDSAIYKGKVLDSAIDSKTLVDQEPVNMKRLEP